MVKYIKELIKKHPQLWEIFKFLLIGGLATIVDFLVMALVMYFIAPSSYDNNFLNVILESEKYKDALKWYVPIIGTAVGFIFGLGFNYLFSITFVFDETGFAKTKKGMMLFVILALCGFFIHVVGMWVGTDILSLNYWLIKIFLTIVVLIFNYVTRKKLIFNKN